MGLGLAENMGGKMRFDPLGLEFLYWEFCFNTLSKKEFYRIKLNKIQIKALWNFIR